MYILELDQSPGNNLPFPGKRSQTDGSFWSDFCSIHEWMSFAADVS